MVDSWLYAQGFLGTLGPFGVPVIELRMDVSKTTALHSVLPGSLEKVNEKYCLFFFFAFTFLNYQIKEKLKKYR